MYSNDSHLLTDFLSHEILRAKFESHIANGFSQSHCNCFSPKRICHFLQGSGLSHLQPFWPVSLCPFESCPISHPENHIFTRSRPGQSTTACVCVCVCVASAFFFEKSRYGQPFKCNRHTTENSCEEIVEAKAASSNLLPVLIHPAGCHVESQIVSLPCSTTIFRQIWWVCHLPSGLHLKTNHSEGAAGRAGMRALRKIFS